MRTRQVDCYYLPRRLLLEIPVHATGLQYTTPTTMDTLELSVLDKSYCVCTMCIIYCIQIELS